jgi:hypothetical protein
VKPSWILFRDNADPGGKAALFDQIVHLHRRMIRINKTAYCGILLMLKLTGGKNKETGLLLFAWLNPGANIQPAPSRLRANTPWSQASSH